MLKDGTGTGDDFTRNSTRFSDLPGIVINSLTVSLDITGGFNGHLYAFLSKDAGFTVLLNRPGREAGRLGGYIDPGMNITLADGSPDVHLYTPYNQVTRLTGTWSPDGRETSPTDTMSSDARTAYLLSSFGGVTADGVWTLYVEDVVSGQEATLNSWTLNLEVDTVPEPGAMALSAVVLCGVAGYAARRYRRRMV